MLEYRRRLVIFIGVMLLQSPVEVDAEDHGNAAAGTEHPATNEHEVLPVPAAPFAGRIGQTYEDSVPAFPKPISAPAQAPNVLLVLTDDVGFSAASTFGGPVPTPNLDELARQGLLYNHFHTTAMCSPTRASLLTGRNHHAVGNGTVANFSSGYPGYWSLIPKSAATLAEVLRQNGYNTAMFGKHHNTPEDQVSTAGPFDLWPLGLGFEHFYGFIAADSNQFTPVLYIDNTLDTRAVNGMLEKIVADEAIRWIHNQKAAAPDKPFFIYYAPGSTHEPHQAPREWIERFRGRFDRGWDAVRSATFVQQRSLGIIPENATLTPRPEGLIAWDLLSPALKRTNARMMEVYAAMLAYQDAQFGRVLQELQRMGELHHTLVMFIEGDNGASGEGGPYGSTNGMAGFANGMHESEAELLAHVDDFGGPRVIENYSYGWAWAMNTPFKLFKEYASHLGGTRDGLVISWPDRIKTRGIRTQFGHVNDIFPTVLEAAGIAAPLSVNGVTQQRIDGVSLVYTFDDASAPERHDTQYFEMMGNRAIYYKGWLANTIPTRLPWPTLNANELPTRYGWELYDLKQDFSQANDLARKQPQKLHELQDLFMSEAQKNHVFPLDSRLDMARFNAAHAQLPVRDHYTYWGSGISLPVASAAPILDRGFTITAHVTIPNSAATGVILAAGSQFGGWCFYLKDGRPMAYVAASQQAGDQSLVESGNAITPGKAMLTYQFQYDGGMNAGGTMIISVDGREVGRGRIKRTLSKFPQMIDTLDVGFDAGTPVTADYPDGGYFPGDISRVDIALGPFGQRTAARQ